MAEENLGCTGKMACMKERVGKGVSVRNRTQWFELTCREEEVDRLNQDIFEDTSIFQEASITCSQDLLFSLTMFIIVPCSTNCASL